MVTMMIGGRSLVVVLVATISHRNASLGGCGGWLDGVLEGCYRLMDGVRMSGTFNGVAHQLLSDMALSEVVLLQQFVEAANAAAGTMRY